MDHALHVLILADSDLTRAVVRTLHAAADALTFLRVDSLFGLLAALEAQPWDLIIAAAVPDVPAAVAVMVADTPPYAIPVVILADVGGAPTQPPTVPLGAAGWLPRQELATLGPLVQRVLGQGHRHRPGRRPASEQATDRVPVVADGAARPTVHELTIQRPARVTDFLRLRRWTDE